ncbi:MAG: SufE family protein [Candidatus Woesearchaeota archaeon]
MNEQLVQYAQILTQAPTRWDMLTTLTEIGKDLPGCERSEQNKVPHCLSSVFLDVRIQDNKIKIHIDADAHIIRGYAKILYDAFDNMPVKDFLQSASTDIKEFVEKTQINSSFLSSRANSFGTIFLYLQKKVQERGQAPNV